MLVGTPLAGGRAGWTQRVTWWYGSAAADVASHGSSGSWRPSRPSRSPARCEPSDGLHYPGIQIFVAFTTEAPEREPELLFRAGEEDQPLVSHQVFVFRGKHAPFAHDHKGLRGFLQKRPELAGLDAYDGAGGLRGFGDGGVNGNSGSAHGRLLLEWCRKTRHELHAAAGADLLLGDPCRAVHGEDVLQRSLRGDRVRTRRGCILRRPPASRSAPALRQRPPFAVPCGRRSTVSTPPMKDRLLSEFPLQFRRVHPARRGLDGIQDGDADLDQVRIMIGRTAPQQ